MPSQSGAMRRGAGLTLLVLALAACCAFVLQERREGGQQGLSEAQLAVTDTNPPVGFAYPQDAQVR